MNRLEFIFGTVNAIASKRQEPTTEYLLVEAVQREIGCAKRELCMGRLLALETVDDHPQL